MKIGGEEQGKVTWGQKKKKSQERLEVQVKNSARVS